MRTSPGNCQWRHKVKASHIAPTATFYIIAYFVATTNPTTMEAMVQAVVSLVASGPSGPRGPSGSGRPSGPDKPCGPNGLKNRVGF